MFLQKGHEVSVSSSTFGRRANREKSIEQIENNRGFRGGQRCKLCTYWASASGIQNVPGLQVQPFCFGHKCQKLIEAPAIENCSSLNALAFKIQVSSCLLKVLQFLPHFEYSICALVWESKSRGYSCSFGRSENWGCCSHSMRWDLLLLTLRFLICSLFPWQWHACVGCSQPLRHDI